MHIKIVYQMNFLKSLVLTLLTVTTAVSTYAQPAGYADQQSSSTAGLCLQCTVDNPNNAVDGNEDTFSYLNIPAGVAEASIQQNLQFPFLGKQSDEIAIVLGTTDAVDISVLANVAIYTSNFGVPNNDESQIDLGSIGADPDDAAKFTYRFNAQFDFNAVHVRLNAPAAGLSDNIKIYAAYDQNVVNDSTAFIPVCILPDNQTSGVEGNCIVILGQGCVVNNAPAAMDGDNNTYSELLVQSFAAGGGPFQTFTLDNPACGVDSFNVLLSGNDGAGGSSDLLGLGINPTAPGEEDGALEIAAVDINGDVITGSEQFVQTTNVNASEANNLRYEFTYVPNASIQEYYGVRVWYHGVTSASGINIHEVCVNRFMPPAPNGNIVDFCYNTVGPLTVTPAPNTVAYWHATNNPSDLQNDAIFVGSTFNPATNNPGFKFTNDTTFYIFGRNVNKDCFSLEYDSIFVSVYDELPDPLQFDVTACYGSTENIFPQVFGPIYNMYADAAGTDSIKANAQAFQVGPILSDTTFYVQTTNEAGCISANIIPINVNLKEELFFAEVDTLINSCIGEDVTVTIANPVGGVTYNWYTASLGGSLLFTGTEYTFNLIADTDLYIDAVAISGGCDSSIFRKHVEISAVAKPTLTAGDVFLLVCPNDSVDVVGQSSAGDVVWYDAATGGNELFRGNSFRIYDNGGVQRVYAEATNDRCLSDTRQEYVIQSTTDILIQLADLSTSVCENDDVTINAPTIANVTFTFWDAALAGNQIGAGSSITILNLTQDTTFYVQIDQANCTNSINNRTAVTLTVTTPPSMAVVEDVVYGCVNDNLSFSVDTPNPAYTYTWLNDQGAVVFTGTTFNFELISDTMTFFVQVAEGLCPNPALIELTAYKGEDLLNPLVNGGTPVLICIGNDVTLNATATIPNATFNWYSAAVGGTLLSTGATYTVPSSQTTSDFSVFVQAQYQNICGDGLSERVEVFIDVRAKLAAPVVSCGTSGTDFVTFKWTSVPNTTAYVVKVNNGPDVVLPGNQLSYVVNGINAGQTVSIDVIRRGTLACEESNNTSFTCTSKACTFVNDADAPTFTPSLGQICDGESFQFKITPSDKPVGNYTVKFTNLNTGVVEVFQNGDNFLITKNTINARSYNEPNLNPIDDVYTYNLSFEMDDEPGCTKIVNRDLLLKVNFTPVVKFVAIANVPSVVGQFINSFTFNNLTSGTYIQEYDFGDGTAPRIDTLFASGEQEPVTHIYQEESPLEGFKVKLTVTTADGCSTSGFLPKNIVVSTVPEIFIPNTFSPNSDDNNDTFRVFGENIKLVSLKVFNNYGNELYRSGDLTEGWNGTYEGENQPSGVYAYTAVIEDFLGNKYNREGTITLIRK
jgi:gliding motility-associated-like protein